MKDHRNLIWCGGRFLFWQSRFDMYHHLQHWRRFLIYLVEIACSWIAATVNSVYLLRVEDFNHWLYRSLLIWVCSRCFVNCPLFSFFWVSLQFVDACGFDGEFRRQFPHGSQLLNIVINFITTSLCLLVDIFFPWVTYQVDVSFRNFSSEFKR